MPIAVVRKVIGYQHKQVFPNHFSFEPRNSDTDWLTFLCILHSRGLSCDFVQVISNAVYFERVRRLFTYKSVLFSETLI